MVGTASLVDDPDVERFGFANDLEGSVELNLTVLHKYVRNRLPQGEFGVEFGRYRAAAKSHLSEPSEFVVVEYRRGAPLEGIYLFVVGRVLLMGELPLP